MKQLIEQAIEPVLGKQVYQAKKIHDWTSSIVEGVLKSLQAANKPFKYVVTCIIMQKNGAGLHTASGAESSNRERSLPPTGRAAPHQRSRARFPLRMQRHRG